MSYRALITLALPTFNEKYDFCIRLNDDLEGAEEIVEYIKTHNIAEGLARITEAGERTGVARLEFKNENERKQWGHLWADQRWLVIYSESGGVDVRQYHQHTARVQTAISEVAGILEDTDSATLDQWEREQASH